MSFNMNNLWKNDPVMKELIKGERMWGNIIYNANRGRSKSRGRSTSSARSTTLAHSIHRRLPTWAHTLDPYFQEQVLDLLQWESDETYLGSKLNTPWKVPDLRTRKAIWENFPVIVNKIDSEDHTDRYEILWHEDHLKEWYTRALSFNEVNNYKFFSEYRLLYSLAKHTKQYHLEPPTKENQIAILAMVHTGERSTTRKQSRSPSSNNRNRTRKNAIPTLRRLNDIKEHFPFVLWNEVEGKEGTKTYELGINSKSEHAKKEEDRLMSALKASKFWHVLPSKQKKFCRLEMIAKK